MKFSSLRIRDCAPSDCGLAGMAALTFGTVHVHAQRPLIFAEDALFLSKDKKTVGFFAFLTFQRVCTQAFYTSSYH
jgi:hypothetical protein